MENMGIKGREDCEQHTNGYRKKERKWPVAAKKLRIGLNSFGLGSGVAEEESLQGDALSIRVRGREKRIGL